MKSVVQTFRVLEEVSVLQPVGVSELARVLEIPKSTVHRMLKTLEEVGWVRQKSSGQSGAWIITAAPIILASRVAQDVNLRETARPEMEWLRSQCREAVHLAIRQGSEVVIIDQLEALHDIRIDWPIGKHSPLHTSANGKAIVAFTEGHLREELYPKSFEAFTENTITSTEAFDAELATVIDQGYAVARGELREDIYSFAAPILDASGSALASISAFMPTYRAPADEREMGELVRTAADRIRRKLMSGNPATPR